MANMILTSPLPVAALAASRGSGAANLLTAAPKEIWADNAAGSAVTIDIDLGVVRTLDTVFLGYVHGPAAGATWTITGGVAGYTEAVVKASGALRVPDVTGRFPDMSHALWFGAASTVRYLRLSLNQPAGSPALKAGILLVGKSFQSELNREWGSGRKPIDGGTATALPSGDFGIVEGAKRRGFYWSYGDLSADEVEELEEIVLAHGVTRPLLVVEDPAQTAALRTRIHYGTLTAPRQFERRNRAQTRWELGVEGWV